MLMHLWRISFFFWISFKSVVSWQVFFYYFHSRKKTPEQLISVIGTFNQRGGNNQ